MKKLINRYENFESIIVGLFSATLFSAFIYLYDLGFDNKFINTLLALSAYYLLLHIPKKAVLASGFFIGIFWFYWISYSFKYNDAGYIAPFVVIGFGLVYMLYFGVAALCQKAYMRALLLFIVSFYAPLDFNWMQLSLVFVDSYIGVQKWQLAVVLFALGADDLIKNKKLKYIPLIFIITASVFFQKEQPLKMPPIKIKLVQTDVKQEEKWRKENLRPTIIMVYNEILNAKKQGYDVVVLPESVVPLYLNKYDTLIKQFKTLAKDIDIVLGALMYENGKNYNVTYHFSKDKIEIAKKVVLVPFGEYIPLPKFIRDFINEKFFAGASDFKTAKKPTDFNIKGIKFRNAVCYEATTDTIYEGDVKYVIATSNNAWFAPSIEPTLQRLLMKYYAKKYHVIIFHSAKYKGSGIILN